MMERSKRMNVPEIRFKGEQLFLKKQLKEIATINPKNALPDFFEYVDLESVVGTEMKKHRTEIKESAPSRAQRLANKGDIFFQTVRPYQQNNLYFDLDAKNFVFSTGYAQIRSKINSKYLFTILQQSNFLNQVLENCTGSSYPAINPSSLANLFLTICDNEVVQQKLASYFQSLDSLIQTTSKELASLKQIKAASLQSMFPQEGETVPKVRFKGFEGEWDKVKLSTLGQTYSGLTGKTKEDFNFGDSLYIPFLNVLLNPQIDESNLQKVRVENNEKQNEIHKGDILFNTSSETPEEVGLCSVFMSDIKKVYLNSFCFGFRLFNNLVDPSYIVYLLRSQIGRKLMLVLAQGATRYNLSKKSFLNAHIIIPTSQQEQQKIASYFCNLDKQLSLQAQRLEKLKQIKAACLDKMFV